MEKKILKTAVLALSTLLIFSCEKYENGPAISLIPRNERIANTWVIEKAIQNDEDVTSQYDQYEVYYTSDGDSELSAEYTAFGVEFQTETQGTWSLTNNDEDLVVDYQDDSEDEEYQILKLTSKELWLREKGEDLELHLGQK